MPKVGFKQFPYTAQGIAEAESYSEATGVPVSDSGIPVSNAMERNVLTYWDGGRVTPQEGLDNSNVAMGQLPSPNMPRYNKGGKVNKKKGRK